MSRKQKMTADLLFVVQLGLAVFFAGSQFLHMLNAQTLQGASVTMFVAVEIFVVMNLYLAFRAHRTKPSRVTFQVLFTYSWWTVLWSGNFGIIAYHTVTDFHTMWSMSEYVNIAVVLLGLLTVSVVSKIKNMDPRDPILKGLVALVFKATPQLFQAWKFYAFGGASWAGFAVLGGHLTILTRLGQLGFSVKEVGWDRNRIGSVISEIGNELSWLLATGAWVWWRFF